ncbi:DUF6596 domain-containing protein [Micromonospora sp. M12]
MLAALQPDEPEVHGLLALCELTAARFPARTGADGSPILLEDQDRRLWDFSAVRRGLTALARASTRGLGPYGLQAAIAAATRRRPRWGQPTGTGSWCSTRRSAGSRPRRWSSSTGPSPWPWPRARHRPWPSWTS